MSEAGTGAPTGHPRRAYRLFAALWACAILFDHSRNLSPSTSLAMLLLALALRGSAVWVLLRPSRPLPFLVLNGALAVTIFAGLPKGANHRILVFLIAATVAACALRVGSLRRPGSGDRGADLFESFAPLVRWQLVALYFWAVVQKLNVDFFDPAISCGPSQVWNLQRLLPFFPSVDALREFSIYGTLLVEAAIPCLLIPRRTRLLGIALAMGFHLVIGAGYVGFSACLFALLSLFAPPDWTAALWRTGAALRDRARFAHGPVDAVRRVAERAVAALVVLLLAGSAVAALFFADARSGFWGPRWISSDLLLALWFAVGGFALLAFGAVSLRAGWCAGERGALRPRHASLAFLPVLVFAVGLGPHLGIKNTQAFAMFSNLKTGGGTSNHLFIPSAWQISDNLSDLVTIWESNDVALAKLVGPTWSWFNYFSTYTVETERLERQFAPPRWRLPYLALRRRVTDLAEAGAKNLRIVYERDGITYRVDNAEDDPELSSLGWWARKLLLLRAVPDTDRGYCLW